MFVLGELGDCLIRVGIKLYISDFFKTLRSQYSLRYYYPAYILQQSWRNDGSEMDLKSRQGLFAEHLYESRLCWQLCFVSMEADEVEMMKLIVNGNEVLTLNQIGMVNNCVSDDYNVDVYDMNIHTWR